MRSSATGYDPKRVLHVILTLGVGGAEQLVYRMALAGPRDQRPAVCCLLFLGELGERLKKDGGKVYCRNHQGGIDLGIVRWLREIIVAERIEVVHAHTYTPLFYSVPAVLGMSGVQVVYTEHGRLYPERSSWKQRLVSPLLAAGTRHLVTISESTARAMHRYDNFPFRRIRVIHNGISLEHVRGRAVDLGAKRSELGIGARTRVVGTACRIEEIKNLPMMLHAFQRVVEQVPDSCLLVAGKGSREQELRELAQLLGIGTQVKFLGLRDDLAEIYPLMNVFLLSSLTEGISVTLLESMAAGVPAVATAVGGNPEVVLEGETGFLVPLHDDALMAERILYLLRDPQLAAGFGARARVRVLEEFSFDRMLQRYQELYQG
ncbi:glycosyl transferase family 1 [Geomonas limicola]|uniref:Glycosyl transferase family 1 n=1 Tax=Geomonas limicola TaxID=2740186 RepID=A0A6V8N4K9_9BACT|nr:glycosyltransferase [Geomonas limicola]GFO66553.1 glycosyl transferase family 1 [Geomonas limicola]